jgi:hypothetical protein
MFCKWCEMAGFKYNDRGKPTVWTGAGEGCQRTKLQSVKDHEGTPTHKEAANLLPARCVAAEMLSVEVKTKGEDGNVTRDTQHVNLEQAYRTTPACVYVQGQILCSVSAFGSGECFIQ